MFNRFILISLVMILSFLPGCQGKTSDSAILIDGSTTMFDLSKAWADAYMQKNPGVVIKVSQSGTDQGIQSFIEGKCDIAESSRKLTTEEILKAKEKNVDVGEFYVGFALYSVAVNPKNPVENLDEEQIKDIFLGKINNWKDIGGEDKKIEVLYREIGPHQYDYFLEKFVNIGANVDLNNLPSNIKILASPEEIVDEVSKNDEAVGYFLIQYQDDKTKPLGVSKKGTGKFLKPTIENAATGGYPVLRPYYMYMSKYAAKPLRDYIEFIYSKDGVEIAKKMHFVPVPTKNGDVDRSVLFEYI